MRVRLLGLGIMAPGLADWASATAILRGERSLDEVPLQVPPPMMLSPNERRRATLATRLALEAARQACDGAAPAQSDLVSVFASADGDMGLIDHMCRAIYSEHSAPSPTVFQNSVHNAVAGYWSIATGCRQPSSSIAAGDGSFAAGLLEAATLVGAQGRPGLLVAFDVPGPELLHPHRTFGCAFACSLLLAPPDFADGHPILDLTIRTRDDIRPETRLEEDALEAMRVGNPAARSLPLLATFVNAEPRRVRLPYWPDLQLDVAVEQDR